MVAAPIGVRGAELEPGTPVPLFPTHIVGSALDSGIGRQYEVALAPPPRDSLYVM